MPTATTTKSTPAHDRDGRCCEACGTGHYISAGNDSHVRCVRCSYVTERFDTAAAAA